MNQPATFNISVSAFIVRDGRLLVLRRNDNYHALPGYWDVPGGKIDEGETLLEGLVRETKEESSSEIVPGELFDVFEYTNHLGNQALNIGYLCQLADDSPEPQPDGTELVEAAWVTADELEDKKMTPEMRRACEKALELSARGNAA